MDANDPKRSFLPPRAFPGETPQPNPDTGMEPGPSKNPADALPPGTDAKASMQKLGGNPGGKPRQDGFAPGSPQAIAADREKERLKKQRQRERKRLETPPPPLPTADAAKGPPVPDQVPPQAGIEGTDNPPASAPGFVPWQAEALREFTDELIDATEDARVAKLAIKCKQAHLPADLMRKVESDCKFSPVAKKGLKLSTPQVAAKLLNASGISAAYQAEAVFVTSLAMILAQGKRVTARLDRLIAQRDAQQKEKCQTTQTPPA